MHTLADKGDRVGDGCRSGSRSSSEKGRRCVSLVGVAVQRREGLRHEDGGCGGTGVRPGHGQGCAAEARMCTGFTEGATTRGLPVALSWMGKGCSHERVLLMGLCHRTCRRCSVAVGRWWGLIKGEVCAIGVGGCRGLLVAQAREEDRGHGQDRCHWL